MKKDDLDGLLKSLKQARGFARGRTLKGVEGHGPAEADVAAVAKTVLKPRSEGPVGIWDGTARRASSEHDGVHDEV